MAFKLTNGRATAQQLAEKRVALKAQELRTEIINTLSQPAKGRQYGNHRASAPGDAPAVDSGDLRRSIGLKKIPNGWRVGTNQKHGLFMEYGTRTIAARPWMRPSVDKVKKRG